MKCHILGPTQSVTFDLCLCLCSSSALAQLSSAQLSSDQLGLCSILGIPSGRGWWGRLLLWPAFPRKAFRFPIPAVLRSGRQRI